MSILGKVMRLGNLLREDGRVLIVAMDHGMIGTTKGIEKIEETIRKVIEGGADAVMINLGVAKKCYKEVAGKVNFVLSIPFDAKYVEKAVKIGADAIKTTYFGPVPLEEYRMKQISEIARESDEWGIPYLVEVVPTDSSGKVLYDFEKIKQAARIGAELGGDLIKTAYTTDSSQFKHVVDSCPVPIVVMGGPKMESDIEVLKIVKGCIDAGGAGVSIGRNIWQHKDPVKMTKAIAKILHQNATVDEAFKELK